MTQDNDAGKAARIIVHADSDLEDLIPGFLDNRRKDIKLMLEALDKSDYDAVRMTGHSMKGAGGGYGFDAITEIGAAIERSAKDKDPEGIRKNIDELSTYLKNVEVRYE